MLCEKCKKKNATVHIKKSINGKKTEMYLCADCAKDYEDVFMNPTQLFSSVLGYGTPSRSRLVCPTCGMTDSEFSETGYLGCPDCYKAFATLVDKMISRVQPAGRHVGNRPDTTVSQTLDVSSVSDNLSEEDQLKNKLKAAIADEDYLTAAKLRDELKALTDKHKEGH